MGMLCLGGCPLGLHLPVLLGSVPKDHPLVSFLLGLPDS